MHFPRRSLRLLILTIASLLALVLFGCHHSVETDLSEGDTAFHANNLGEAEQHYQAAVKAAPNDPRAHVALGNLYAAQQKIDQAQLEYMRAIHLDPRMSRAHLGLGDLYFKQQKYLLAEEQYRAAVALAPATDLYRIQLAEDLRRQNRLGEAEIELRTAIGLDPEDARAHFAIAKLLETEPNRGPEADAELASAHELDPNLVPNAAPSAPVVASAAPARPAPPPFKPLNKLWKVTHDADVFQDADPSSTVVGHVRRKGYVHVTGIQGDYLQIKLRGGTLGFIPTSAAE